MYIITQGEHGGGQKHVFDLATGMKEKGQEIYVAVGKIENDGDKWLHAELEKTGFKKEYLLEIQTLQREVSIIKALKAFFEIRKVVRKINPDIVHLHSVMAGTVGAVSARLAFKNVVYTVHGFTFLEPLNILKKVFYILSEFVASFFRDFTILISEKDILAGKKFWILRNSQKYSLIYNGLKDLQIELLGRTEAREYFSKKIGRTIDESTKVVGTISNLYKTKGLEYLIDAASKLDKNILFLVMGTGDEKYLKELQERVMKNNLQNNFYFLGKTENAFKYLPGLDLFTLTSVKEGLPYCLLEAKQAGLPILATNVGGVGEIAKNFPINLVESKNVVQIADKIKEVLDNKEKFQNESLLPEVYRLENMISKVENVYQNLL
jgi:glycosyltransferase involved in cell wall biosynthesis